MLTVVYAKSGRKIADHIIEDTARKLCRSYMVHRSDYMYTISNRLFLEAMRLMVLEKEIASEDILIRVEEVSIKINEQGEFEKEAEGLPNFYKELSSKIKDRQNKIKKT